MRKKISIYLYSIALTALAACGGASAPGVSGPCGSATNPIVVGGETLGFSPADCEVSAGQVVSWTWGGGTHSVTNDPGQLAVFDSTLVSGATYQLTVPADSPSGAVIHYHCSSHAVVSNGACTGMCATLTVK